MHSVVLVGTFPQLLLERKRALEAAGYDVHIARDPWDAVTIADSDDCKAAVIGHAVYEEERVGLVKTLKARRPDLKVICLYFGTIQKVEDADAVLQVTSTVADLVRAVRYLTAV